MNKRGTGIVAAIIGAILAIVGLILGLVPLQQVGQDCGSVFSGKSYGAFTEASALVDVYCEHARNDRAIWVWGLIVVGLIAVVVGVILAVQRQEPIEPDTPRPSLSEARAGRAQDAAAPATTRSVADEIAALAALRDSGTLSPEEFEAAKQRALERQ